MSSTDTFVKEYPAMYILVKEDVPLGLAMAAVGHAAVAAYSKFSAQEDTKEIVGEWFLKSFRKVVCKVSQKEFDHAKALTLPHVVMTELALDRAETAIAFCPTREFPKFMGYLKLYK